MKSGLHPLKLFSILTAGLLLVLLLSVNAMAASATDKWLKVSVSGVSKRLEKNILAHLGSLPESDAQRLAYLFNVNAAVDAALQSMGHYHGKVTKTLGRSLEGPWELTLKVSPGEATRIDWVDIRFAGEMLEDERFDRWLNGIKIRPGAVLNHGKYEDIKAELSALALSRGYFDGHYTKHEIRVNRDENRATISLHYDSGRRYRMGSVSFEGHTLKEGFLEQLVPFNTDTTYATWRLSRLSRRLQETGYFRSVKVLPQLDKTEDGTVPVRVELENRPAHSFEVGLGADIGSNTDKSFEPRVRISWRTPQINRHGHSQETSIEWSPDSPKFLTTYSIPLTHPLNDKLLIRLGLLRDLYGHTQEYDAGRKEYVNTGQLESTKQLLALVRQQHLSDDWLMGYSISYIHERFDQFDSIFTPTFILGGVNFSNTVRGDRSLDPKWGYRQSYSLDYADPSLGSAARLTRLEAKLKWINTFFDKHRLVARADFGVDMVSDADRDLVPPSLRYFAGGDQSIRGYSYQELGPYMDYTNDVGNPARDVVGGRYLAVGSFEYQYYLTPSWRLATFIDGGNAYDKGQFDPVMSVGGGVHWISPIGPIRLDLGVGLQETETVARSWRIHLTMGSEL